MLFTTAARYYADLRPLYPFAMFQVLADRFQLDYESLVIDVGCGPGIILLPMSRFAGRVVGIDPEPQMLHEVRRRTPLDSGVGLIQAKAEHMLQFRDLLHGAKLATFGRSFHWTNRRYVLKVLDQLLAPGGGVAITAGPGHGVGHEPTDVETASQAVLRAFATSATRIRRNQFIDAAAAHNHQTILAQSAFSDIDEVYFPTKRTWTIPEYIGYLGTTSTGAQIMEEAGRERVRAALHNKLMALRPSGIIERRGLLTVYIAKRPTAGRR